MVCYVFPDLRIHNRTNDYRHHIGERISAQKSIVHNMESYFNY